MYTFIVNPNSGNETGFRKWKKIEHYLQATRIEYKAYLTDEKNDAVKLAAKLSKACNLAKEELILIAVGGDGTMNRVLEGLNISEYITLGFIPTGTGNDLARGLKLPRTPMGCLRRILKPKGIKNLDYGIVSYGEGLHSRFIVSCGMGFDAEIVKEKEEMQTRAGLLHFRFKHFSYILTGIKKLLQLKASKAYMILDDTKRLELNHFVFVSSHIHPYEGGGFRFSPQADCMDGELSLCVVYQHIRHKLAQILLSALFGNHLKYSGVRSFDCAKLVIHTDNAFALHADGEYLGMVTDAELSCIKGKIKCIV